MTTPVGPRPETPLVAGPAAHEPSSSGHLLTRTCNRVLRSGSGEGGVPPSSSRSWTIITSGLFRLFNLLKGVYDRIRGVFCAIAHRFFSPSATQERPVQPQDAPPQQEGLAPPQDAPSEQEIPAPRHPVAEAPRAQSDLETRAAAEDYAVIQLFDVLTLSGKPDVLAFPLQERATACRQWLRAF